jgi:hypothetical protein
MKRRTTIGLDAQRLWAEAQSCRALSDDLILDLHRALGLRPWHVSPLDATTQKPPEWMRHDPRKVSLWQDAWQLRQRLMDDQA